MNRNRLIQAGVFVFATVIGASAYAADPAVPAAAAAPFPVTILVDVAATKGDLHPIWRFFGADEPNYAYMKDGQKLIGELGKMRPKQTFFRAHNLLTTGDGTPALKWGSTDAYNEDAQGNPIYNWTIMDRIIDTYLDRGVRPYAQIGFMPKAMSINPEPYQHRYTPLTSYGTIYTGWTQPPKDYVKWGNLAYEWAKHSVEKYGRAEVESWYWEVWNEPNIDYWMPRTQGGVKIPEFQKLHDYAIEGVLRALPTAKVGGPDVAGDGGNFTRSFLEHCLRGTNYATGKIGTKIDFISFHAKGAPTYTNDHVRMGIANQLRTINAGYGIVASFPELKTKPIIIGESDPDGCAACNTRALGYRNTTLFSSYTAASFARKQDIADIHGVNIEGAITWAFEFEDQPMFPGFRALSASGIDLPVMNVFRMLNKMGKTRLTVQSDKAVALNDIMRSGVRGEPDVSAIASLEGNKLAVFAWHYHDDDLAGPDAEVELAMGGLPVGVRSASVQHYRIDQEHSNSFVAWKKMGSPAIPTPAQYAELDKAGQLATLGAPQTVTVQNNAVKHKFTLPRQAVSLLMFDLVR